MKLVLSLIGYLFLGLYACQESDRVNQSLVRSELFMELPDICPTPDGMAIASNGDLILASPNFADSSQSACLMRIISDKLIFKWMVVPILPETGVACPMGIAFNEKGNELYICDNQGWTGCEKGRNKGRILKLIFNEENVCIDTVVIACNMEHPNGIRYYKGKIYVTQSSLSEISSDLLVSGVYCFDKDDCDISVTNTRQDANLLATVFTRNPQVQYGLDGITFDSKGNLYVGNFGDGSIHRIVLDEDGRVTENAIWVRDTTQLLTTDGICMDADDNMYVADFSANAIARITKEGVITRISQSPDCDGSQGGLDQPSEPIVWNGKLIVSCFDIVTGPDKVNTKHDKPYTLAMLDLNNK